MLNIISVNCVIEITFDLYKYNIILRNISCLFQSRLSVLPLV